MEVKPGAAASFFPELLQVSCAVNHVKNFDPFRDWLVEDEVIIEAFHTKRAQVPQFRPREFPKTAQLRCPSQFLERIVRRLEETIGSVHVVESNIFPYRRQFGLGELGKYKLSRSGGAPYSVAEAARTLPRHPPSRPRREIWRLASSSANVPTDIFIRSSSFSSRRNPSRITSLAV
jgi:hypothetical protein